MHSIGSGANTGCIACPAQLHPGFLVGTLSPIPKLYSSVTVLYKFDTPAQSSHCGLKTWMYDASPTGRQRGTAASQHITCRLPLPCMHALHAPGHARTTFSITVTCCSAAPWPCALCKPRSGCDTPPLLLFTRRPSTLPPWVSSISAAVSGYSPCLVHCTGVSTATPRGGPPCHANSMLCLPTACTWTQTTPAYHPCGVAAANLAASFISHHIMACCSFPFTLGQPHVLTDSGPHTGALPLSTLHRHSPSPHLQQCCAALVWSQTAPQLPVWGSPVQLVAGPEAQ